MSNDHRPPMSAIDAKKRDDRTIALVSRALRKGHPFFLAQGGNGRVIHISGEQVVDVVDRLFAKIIAGERP